MGPYALEIAFLLVELGLFTAAVLFFRRAILWFVFGQLDAPFVPTPKRYASVVTEALDVQAGDTVYELGSGDGRFVLACAKLSPTARFLGVERNIFLHLIASTRKRFAGNPTNVEFRRGDLFETDLSHTNKMYLYLLTPAMLDLQSRFEKEFSGRVASRAFKFANKEPSSVVALGTRSGAHGQHNLYVYDFE
jgi:hypothetical protein